MSVGTYWPWEPTATLRSALCISAVGLAARGASAPTEGERGGVAAARLQLIIIFFFARQHKAVESYYYYYY